MNLPSLQHILSVQLREKTEAVLQPKQHFLQNTCFICNRSFVNRSNMNRHIKTTHMTTTTKRQELSKKIQSIGGEMLDSQLEKHITYSHQCHLLDLRMQKA